MMMNGTTTMMNTNSTAPTSARAVELWENTTVVAIVAIVSFAVLGNICVVLVTLKSDIRATISGHLLINQAIADIGFLVVSLVMLIFRKWYVTEDVDAIITFLVLAWSCVIGAGAHSMAIVSVNLFLAICHSSKYKTMVTKKRLDVSLMISWFINGLFFLQYFYYDKFMYYDHRHKRVMSNYSPHVVWMGVLIILNCPAIPLVTTMVCFAYILKHTRRVLPSALNINSIYRFRLSKIILANIVLFSSTYIVLLVAQVVQSKPLNAVSSLIHITYHLTKLPLLLAFYPPLRIHLSLCKARYNRSTHPVMINVTSQVCTRTTSSPQSGSTVQQFQIRVHSDHGNLHVF